MGQKVNPIGLRLGINRSWDSTWYSDSSSYATKLYEDLKIRELIFDKLKNASISKVSIERLAEKVIIAIHTARPGIVIGKKGADIENIKKLIVKKTSKEVQVNITEVKRPEIDAKLIAESIALQLEKRVSFRRAMKRAMQSAMRYGALGIKVACSGRLAGAEIARTEGYKEGRIPLHTLKSNIDYSTASSNTTYGVIGVKIWVYLGEKLTYTGNN